MSRKGDALTAAAKADYESHRPHMQHINPHVHIELWDELPEEEHEIACSHIEKAIDAYEAALAAREDTERPDREEMLDLIERLSGWEIKTTGAQLIEGVLAAQDVLRRSGRFVRDTEQEHEPGVGRNKTPGNPVEQEHKG